MSKLCYKPMQSDWAQQYDRPTVRINGFMLGEVAMDLFIGIVSLVLAAIVAIPSLKSLGVRQRFMNNMRLYNNIIESGLIPRSELLYLKKSIIKDFEWISVRKQTEKPLKTISEILIAIGIFALLLFALGASQSVYPLVRISINLGRVLFPVGIFIRMNIFLIDKETNERIARVAVASFVTIPILALMLQYLFMDIGLLDKLVINIPEDFIIACLCIGYIIHKFVPKARRVETIANTKKGLLEFFHGLVEMYRDFGPKVSVILILIIIVMVILCYVLSLALL